MEICIRSWYLISASNEIGVSKSRSYQCFSSEELDSHMCIRTKSQFSEADMSQ